MQTKWARVIRHSAWVPSRLKFVSFIATTKPIGKRTKSYLVYVAALFDWLTQIRLFFQDKSVSLCNNCVRAARMKEEFIERSLQKGRKLHRPPHQNLCMQRDALKSAQNWFNSACVKSTYLNESKSKWTLITTLVLLQRYRFSIT